MSAEKGRRKLSRWQARFPRLDVDGRVEWLDGVPIRPRQGQTKKDTLGVGQGSLGPRGFLTTNNSQCYCRGRAGACAGRMRGREGEPESESVGERE